MHVGVEIHQTERLMGIQRMIMGGAVQGCNSLGKLITVGSTQLCGVGVG